MATDLVIGFVSVLRPLFKGNAAAAAERSRQRLQALGERFGFTVTAAAEPVTDAASAERAAHELRSRDLDLLLIQHTTFATGELLVPLLHAAERIGLWALPESAGGRGPGGPLPLNSLCGLNMTLSLLEHPQVNKRGPVKWFYGEAESPAFVARLAPTLGALRGLRALHGATVLAIGGTAPGFFGLDEAPQLPGVNVVQRPLAELFERVAAVPDAEAAVLAADRAANETTEVSVEALERSSRIELALAALAAEVGADALAVRCWPELPEACGSMACAAMGDLSGSGMPAACEGDVMGALSMLAVAGVSGRSAILMDLSELDEEGDALQFWHCGNAPLAWAARSGGAPPPRLTTHFNRDGVGVVRDMVLEPGPATAFRLLAGGRRAVIAGGRFGDPQRAGFDGVRGWLSQLHWNGRPIDASGFVANVLDRRLPHHLAFGRGELTEALEELCAWLGAAPLEAHAARPYLLPPREVAS